jgi:hypothetical protein
MMNCQDFKQWLVNEGHYPTADEEAGPKHMAQ